MINLKQFLIVVVIVGNARIARLDLFRGEEGCAQEATSRAKSA